MEESNDKPVNRDSIDNVLDEFERKKETLEGFCVRAKSLIEDLLLDAGLRVQSVQARVKKREKLRDKYLNPDKNYKRLDDITDQAALRIIVYYEDEIDRAAELINKEFNVLPEFSVDKRETDPDRFGYSALNLVCTHSETRQKDVQFKKYATLRFEIQITSVLSHAWSEIEHEWYDLQGAYPSAIKRKFSRLAALLQIAESEFLSLRNQKINYQKSVDIRVESDVPGLTIDAVSLAKFVSLDPIVVALDKQMAILAKRTLAPPTQGTVALNLRVHAALALGFKTLDAIPPALKKYEAPLVEYVERVAPNWGGDNSLQQGLCIYQLALLLFGAQGSAKLVELFKGFGSFTVDPLPDWIPRQSAIAAEVLSKYPALSETPAADKPGSRITK